MATDNQQEGWKLLKKTKKNWRFAYDMYCREILAGHQVISRQEKTKSATSAKGQ
jgi:hypothetical protein